MSSNIKPQLITIAFFYKKQAEMQFVGTIINKQGGDVNAMFVPL